MQGSYRLVGVSWLLLAVGVAGCSGDAPAPAASPDPQAPLTPAAVAASAAPEPSASAAEPSASASASAAKPPPYVPRAPALVFSGGSSLTGTVGAAPAAKFEIGRAVLRVPEGALTSATNVTFEVNAKAKLHKGTVVGAVYHLAASRPPDPLFVDVESNGEPFKVELPAGNSTKAHLAIGKIRLDKQGKTVADWKVIAPKRVDDLTNTAYFEIPALTDSFLHVTNADVTP